MTTETTVTEIADGIYRLSTLNSHIGPSGFTFNQFLVLADEPSVPYRSRPLKWCK
jgi:hypothetical protein